MAKDFVNELFEKTMEEIICKESEKGASEVRIKELTSQEKFFNTYKTMMEQISNDSVETIEKIMYEKAIEEKNFTDEFLARQNQKWGKAFVASDVLYICILESADKYRNYVNETHGQEVSFLYHALVKIHGRALQIYLEIMCLNKNGFADGAYARWRSLYELSVIAAFISKYGEKVAEAFVRSADTEDRYEWARSAISFKNYPAKWKVTFSAIQSRCELATKEWEREYNFVNKLVHASSQGTMYRLGSDTSKVVPVGRSDAGMAISAIHSAISLVQVTNYFFTVFFHGDSTMSVLVFRKWVDRIAKYYKSVEENCLSNEDEE